MLNVVTRHADDTHATDTAFIEGYQYGQSLAGTLPFECLDMLRAEQADCRWLRRGFMKGMLTGMLHAAEAFEAQAVELSRGQDRETIYVKAQMLI